MRKGLNDSTYSSSSSSTPYVRHTDAIFRASVCIRLRAPPSCSERRDVGSALLVRLPDSHTKQLRSAAHDAASSSPNTPANSISVNRSSSPLRKSECLIIIIGHVCIFCTYLVHFSSTYQLNSHATRPFKSTTKFRLTYSSSTSALTRFFSSSSKDSC